MKSIRIILTITISVLVILVVAFQWIIIDWITPFLYPLLFALLIITFSVFFIVNFIHLFKFSEKGLLVFVPVIYQILTILIILYVPFTNLWLKFDFWYYKDERNEIVQNVKDRELTGNVSHNSNLIKLDTKHPLLSLGGNEIVVQERDGLKYILFYTFRGVLDNYSGFLYVPEFGHPTKYSDLDETDATQIIHLEKNWYYVSHH